MIPLLVARLISELEVRDVGDLEYLTTQEFNGNIIRLQDEINAVGNTLTHTASTGKDAYILVAKIIPSGFTGASSRTTQGTTSNTNSTEAKISVNAVEKDRVTVGMGTSAGMSNTGQNNGGPGSGYGALTDGLFYAAVGAKALAAQDIEIENTLDNGNCRAQMVILEVDTGTNPSLVAQNITVEANLTSTGLLAGDFAFLSKKEFDGKRVDVNNPNLTLSGTGAETDLVTQTAAAGKDMYLGEASIGGQVTAASTNLNRVTYKLFVNAVEIDSFREEDPTINQEWTHTFLTKGVKVTTGQIIKITAANGSGTVGTTTVSQGKLLLWEEDTGADPLG